MIKHFSGRLWRRRFQDCQIIHFSAFSIYDHINGCWNIQFSLNVNHFQKHGDIYIQCDCPIPVNPSGRILVYSNSSNSWLVLEICMKPKRYNQDSEDVCKGCGVVINRRHYNTQINVSQESQIWSSWSLVYCIIFVLICERISNNGMATMNKHDKQWLVRFLQAFQRVSTELSSWKLNRMLNYGLFNILCNL